MSAPVVFIPQTPDFGGAEKHLIEVARALDPSRESVIWYYPIDFYSAFLQDRPNVKTLARPGKISLRTVWGFWAGLVRLRPSVVVFVKGVFNAYPWYAYLAARYSGAGRLIAIEHLIADSPPPPDARTGIIGRLCRAVGWRARFLLGKRLQGRLADLTVCVSDAVRQRLVMEYKYPAAKTVTLYCGIDLKGFTPAEGAPDGRSPSAPGGPVRLVCVARLSPVKRIDLLLEALAMLPAAGPAWKCTIVGGGRLEGDLRAKSEALGLAAAVQFTGHVEDVRPYLEKADVCVLSSEKEGLPLSLVEAMAFGLPCVVTDVGGNREIVLHRKTGLLVEFGSPEALASAIEDLLAHPEERQRMGEEARKYVHQRFDASRSLQRYRELLTA